uniref:Uncharacterized protein n=1 Tax=Glossina morsitans morsitans TaxID=37546 RepID=A0A1B0G5X2_GLOMM
MENIDSTSKFFGAIAAVTGNAGSSRSRPILSGSWKCHVAFR